MEGEGLAEEHGAHWRRRGWLKRMEPTGRGWLKSTGPTGGGGAG